jgi:hypothetical protein
MKECLDILASAPDALPFGAWLAHMICAEEVHFQFSMDDPTSSVSVADRNAGIHVKLFEKKMQDWGATVTADMPQGIPRCPFGFNFESVTQGPRTEPPRSVGML